MFAGLRHLWKRRKASASLRSRFRNSETPATFASSRSRLGTGDESSSNEGSSSPGVSVLKPLRGLDPDTYKAFVSQVEQDYPRFEVLFGVRHEDDPAAAEVRRLMRDFPERPIRLIVGAAEAANGKVGVLMELARYARYPIWVLNDSDIKVTSAYLSEVTEQLVGNTGLVTCLYRGRGSSAAARWEALGIATDFMPSTLVAPLMGVREFGLGSTLAFQAADLERVGGFAAVADYLADDYEVAKRIRGLGKKVYLSTYAVETSINEATWRGVWHHQLRWARTIRASKGLGYAGLPITHAGVWALIAVACGAWWPAVILFATRIASALITGWFVLRSRVALAACWLAPVWDLYAFAVWVASYFSHEVRWRDRRLVIDAQGRIQC